MPARIAAAVVPAPPWWTTHAAREKSQPCGTKGAICTFLGTSSAESPAQPDCTTTRRSKSRVASRMIAIVLFDEGLELRARTGWFVQEPVTGQDDRFAPRRILRHEVRAHGDEIEQLR